MSDPDQALPLAAAAPRVPHPADQSGAFYPPRRACETKQWVIRPMTGCTATRKRHRLSPFSGHIARRRLASGIREMTEDAL